MPLDPVRDFGKVQLVGGYDSLATSVTLVTGDGAKLPDPAAEGAYNLVWYNGTDYFDPSDDPDREWVRVVGPAGTGDTKTILRGQAGTTPKNHNTPGKVYKFLLSFGKKEYDKIGTAFLPAANVGGVVHLTAEALAVSGVGILGQALISGGAGAPTWFAPTEGSVLFAGANGILGQDNANFFWDNVNKRLGIGTTGPQALLEVRKDQAAGTSIMVNNANAAGFSRFVFAEGASERGLLQWNVASPNLFLTTIGAHPLFLGTSNAVRMTILSDGNVGIGTVAPKFLGHFAGRLAYGVPNAAPIDADLSNGQVTAYLEEATNTLKFRVKYSTGVLKTGSVSLA